MPRPRGRPPHDDRLTPAEWRTVNAVRHGLTNPQIAALHGISLDAVKYHVANAIAKLGVRNRRALRHWSGAHKDSPVNLAEDDMSENIELAAVGQVSRTVRDIAEAERWYRDALGLKHLYTFGKLAFFDCGGTRLMLTQAEDLNANESLVYFQVADIDAACRELEGRGIEFVSAPHMIHRHEDGTEEWMAFFTDPEGRPLAVMATVGG